MEQIILEHSIKSKYMPMALERDKWENLNEKPTKLAKKLATDSLSKLSLYDIKLINK